MSQSEIFDTSLFVVEEDPEDQESDTESDASSTGPKTVSGSINWDDLEELEEDTGMDTSVTAAITAHTNIDLCGGLIAQEFAHRDLVADMIVSLSTYAQRSPDEVPRIISGLGRIIKVLARSRTPATKTGVLEAAKIPTKTLLVAAKTKPAVTIERVYFANLVPFARKFPGVTIQVSDKGTLSIEGAGIKVSSVVHDFGAISWSSAASKLVSTLSKNTAIYTTTGDPFSDFLVMSYCAHYKIEKQGNPDNTVKVRITSRLGASKEAALPKAPKEVEKAVSYMEKIYDKLGAIIKEVNMATWAGDPTAHFIAALGNKAIVPPGPAKLIGDKVRLMSAYVASCVPKVTINLKSMLGDKDQLSHVTTSAIGKVDNIVRVIESARSWRGADSDVANTTLKDVVHPWWWLGSNVSTTIKWIKPINDIRTIVKEEDLVCAVGCTSDKDKWSGSLSKFTLCRKYDKTPRSGVQELDIMSSDAVLPKCKVILSDVFISLPEKLPKGLSQVAAHCNTQEKVLEKVLELATAAEASAVVVKLFPIVKENVISAAHISKALRKFPNFQYMSVYPGGRGHNLEFILMLSQVPVIGSLSLNKLLSQNVSHETLGHRIVMFLAASSYEVNMLRNCELFYGCVRSEVPDAILLSYIPTGPAKITRGTSDEYDMAAVYQAADLDTEDMFIADDDEVSTTLKQKEKAPDETHRTLLLEEPKKESPKKTKSQKKKEKKKQEQEFLDSAFFTTSSSSSSSQQQAKAPRKR